MALHVVRLNIMEFFVVAQLVSKATYVTLKRVKQTGSLGTMYVCAIGSRLVGISLFVRFQ